MYSKIAESTILLTGIIVSFEYSFNCFSVSISKVVENLTLFFNSSYGYENEYLKVLERAEDKVYSTGLKAIQWKCICKKCGKTFNVTSQNIRLEKVKSCGCSTYSLKGKAHRKHNMFGTRLYRSWAHMISRCYNKNVPAYKNYGGRGITVCDDWRGENGFINFYNWAIKNGYNDKLTIERLDVNGNYEPNNCTWVDCKKQVRNRRNTVKVTVDNVEKPLAEWCEIYNISYYLAYDRIFELGWDSKMALTKPSRKEV